MRHLRTTLIIGVSLVLTMFLGLAGCGDDDGHRMHGDRDRHPRSSVRHDNGRHDNHRGNSGYDRDHR